MQEKIVTGLKSENSELAWFLAYRFCNGYKWNEKNVTKRVMGYIEYMGSKYKQFFLDMNQFEFEE
jgi:hypothetical protein